MKTGWSIEYLENLPSSVYRDIADLHRGVYDRQAEPTFKKASKRESMEALATLIRKQQEANSGNKT